jgi:cytochrome c oxidase subunit 3
MSLTAIQKNNRNLALFLVFATIFLAALFMLNKYFEWSHKFHFKLYPGSDVLKNLPHGELLFFGLYYMMTGLHALHVLAGMVLLSINLFKIKSGKVNRIHYLLLENSALYWHLVDLIWIFIFPLLYLIT